MTVEVKKWNLCVAIAEVQCMSTVLSNLVMFSFCSAKRSCCPKGDFK